jgi:alpha-1,2-mannosyltransferase
MFTICMASLRTGSWLTAERMRVYPLMFAVICLGALAIVWSTGATSRIDMFGRPIGTDFSAFWTAGHMLLEGDRIGMFDPETHFHYQSQFFANPYVDHYGWHYPPFFLLIAAFVATLPYVPGLIVWQAATFAMFAQTIRMIAPPHRLVFGATLGFPATFVTIAHGHNAFLTATLLGCGLWFLDRRPAVAGILIGLLAYKPQFGVVLPLVLLLGGYLRPAAYATATVIAMVAASTLALGPEVWPAFFKGLVFTREVVLEQGGTGWHKIQSVFSAVRSLGGSVATGYVAQACATVIVLAALAMIIVAKADKTLIAAATTVAVLLATPYCLDYDMAILGVTIAFAVRHGVEHGFAPFEKSLLAALWLTPFLARGFMQATGVPIGVIMMIVTFAFLFQRALESAPAKFSPSWRLARG